jgi:hypothetical protein
MLGPLTIISPSSAILTSTFSSGLPTVPIFVPPSCKLFTAITGEVSVNP